MNAVGRRAAALITSVALAALALGGRQWLEGTMARHMLLQIPMLLAAGAAFACGLSPANDAAITAPLAGRLRHWDENGIVGLSAFLLASAYWMIPRALDSAAASLPVDAGKAAALLLAGLLVPGSLARADTIIQLFFVGNFAWMSAIAGMLYQDTPQRLCNLYLIDDQIVAGTGLVALALAVPLLWGIRHFCRDAGAEPEVQGSTAASCGNGSLRRLL